MKANLYRFIRSSLLIVAAFSCSCKKAFIKDEKQDPAAVFDYLWNAMDTKYAMFTYKNVDWKSVYDHYRPMISAGTKPSELFNTCTAMLDKLKDGHVSLTSDEEIYSYNGYYLSFTHNFNYDLLKGYYFTSAKTQGILTYQVSNGIGYIYIPTFEETLKKEDLDAVMNQFASVNSIIIDVRDNTGGSSGLVDYVTEKFLQQRMLLKYESYKKGAGHDDFFAAAPKYLDPSDTRFAGKTLLVLTNRSCFSSCNDFVLYMSELPNAVIIGDQTGGGGGTPFEQELPNGWRFTYSASFTVSPEGVNIESGIKPDFLVSNSLEDDSKGRDAIYEYALKYLAALPAGK